jgi:hypothetical protein
MSNIQKVLKTIASKPSYIDKAKSDLGFKVTPKDRKNLSIMLKRQHIQFNSDIPDNELLRLYLSYQYRAENKRYKLKQQVKQNAIDKKTQIDSLKVKKMLKILDEAQIKGLSEQPKHKRGSINLNK